MGDGGPLVRLKDDRVRGWRGLLRVIEQLLEG